MAGETMDRFGGMFGEMIAKVANLLVKPLVGPLRLNSGPSATEGTSTRSDFYKIDMAPALGLLVSRDSGIAPRMVDEAAIEKRYKDHFPAEEAVL